MRIAGVHLVQTLAQIGSERLSSIVHLDGEGVLIDMTPAQDDDEVVDALGDANDIVVVDAPLAVPGERGRRDIERVCAWLDVPLFPCARSRLIALHGGLRAVELADRLDAAGGEERAWEGSPDQVLRQLIWERERPSGSEPMGLAEYRVRWPAVRPPRYRPKGAGRADPAGMLVAASLLAAAIDLRGWAPRTDAGDSALLEDAAHIDALCCALAGLRALTDPSAAVRLGDRRRGRIVLAAGPDMRERADITLRRMRDEGAIAI